MCQENSSLKSDKNNMYIYDISDFFVG